MKPNVNNMGRLPNQNSKNFNKTDKIMKRKNLISRTAICLYLVLALVMCVGCDGTSITEQIGRDVRTIQSEFEKGYRKPDTSWISVDTVIIDTTIIRAIEENGRVYYRIKLDVPENATMTIRYMIFDSLSVGN